jgi:predicted PurR-regulated permease PerM
MVALGYLCLGLLVGILSGLSSSPIAGALLAALFTFAGGTAAHMLERKPAERRMIATIVASFACTCLAGVITGIVVKENRLLTFESRREELRELELQGKSLDEISSYLKTSPLEAIRTIDVKFAAGDYSAEQAYRELRAELRRLGVE